MRNSEKAVVLQAIRHGDKKYIVRLFTENHGLVTAIAAAGKSGKVKPASLQPLSLVNAELIIKQNRELQQMTETSCYFVSPGFADSMSRLGVAQFINEILIKTLREQSPNPHLFSFIENCIRYLAEPDSHFVNLHLRFLLGLTRYLGFEPQNNFSALEKYFDCREGVFTPMALAFPLGLNERDSSLFSYFLAASPDKLEITREQRQLLLDALLAYFMLHVPGFGEVKSLEVLRALM